MYFMFWDLDLIEGIKTKNFHFFPPKKYYWFWDLDLIEGIKT